MAALTVLTVPQMPRAIARSFQSSKVIRMMASTLGTIIDAPRARQALAAMSALAVGAKAAASDAAIKMTSPASRSLRGPTLSLRVPIGTSRLATIRGKMSMNPEFLSSRGL